MQTSSVLRPYGQFQSPIGGSITTLLPSSSSLLTNPTDEQISQSLLPLNQPKTLPPQNPIQKQSTKQINPVFPYFRETEEIISLSKMEQNPLCMIMPSLSTKRNIYDIIPNRISNVPQKIPSIIYYIDIANTSYAAVGLEGFKESDYLLSVLKESATKNPSNWSQIPIKIDLECRSVKNKFRTELTDSIFLAMVYNISHFDSLVLDETLCIFDFVDDNHFTICYQDLLKVATEKVCDFNQLNALSCTINKMHNTLIDKGISDPFLIDRLSQAGLNIIERVGINSESLFDLLVSQIASCSIKKGSPELNERWKNTLIGTIGKKMAQNMNIPPQLASHYLISISDDMVEIFNVPNDVDVNISAAERVKQQISTNPNKLNVFDKYKSKVKQWLESLLLSSYEELRDNLTKNTINWLTINHKFVKCFQIQLDSGQPITFNIYNPTYEQLTEVPVISFPVPNSTDLICLTFEDLLKKARIITVEFDIRSAEYSNNIGLFVKWPYSVLQCKLNEKTYGDIQFVQNDVSVVSANLASLFLFTNRYPFLNQYINF